MHHIALVVALALALPLAAQQPGNWQAAGTKGAVAAGGQGAVDAGIAILKAGGNAIDCGRGHHPRAERHR